MTDDDGVAIDHYEATRNCRTCANHGWRPIDTAPTGVELLLWEDWGACAVGYRHGESCGWVTEDGRGLTPTHWRPLPDPPGETNG